MTENNRTPQPVEHLGTSAIKENLGDLLTLSRAVIGMVIVSLSLVGKNAYLAVVVLALVGAASDVLDGRAARRYLGENRRGRLGRYDLAVDTLFVLCILGYLSLSGIVIPRVIGLAWIGFALICALIWRLKAKVLKFFEIPTILCVFAVAGVYDLRLFLMVVVPTTIAGVVFNWNRMWYIIRVKIPRDFSE